MLIYYRKKRHYGVRFFLWVVWYFSILSTLFWGTESAALNDLLLSYKVVFVSSSLDLGKTSVIERRIDSGEAGLRNLVVPNIVSLPSYRNLFIAALKKMRLRRGKKSLYTDNSKNTKTKVREMHTIKTCLMINLKGNCKY